MSNLPLSPFPRANCEPRLAVYGVRLKNKDVKTPERARTSFWVWQSHFCQGLPISLIPEISNRESIYYLSSVFSSGSICSLRFSFPFDFFQGGHRGPFPTGRDIFPLPVIFVF